MNNHWWDAFRNSPEQAVEDLLSGRVGVGSAVHVDLPELLYQTFPPHRMEDRAMLDSALGYWLQRMREAYATEIARLESAVYGKRIGDVLIALQLLDLPETREHIRRELDVWLRWLVPLRLAPERDPALECWRLLTRGQTDAGHTASWLRLAEDPRPEYLAVALQGLTGLPNDHDAALNQRLAIRALLRHAANHHDPNAARKFFNGQFRTLRCVFPRTPQHWNQVLKSVAAVDDDVDALAKSLGLAPGDGNADRSAQRPVSEDEIRHLRARIVSPGEPAEELATALFDVLERNRHFAHATGVSYYFVRTLCNLGHLLLQAEDLPGTAAMRRLGDMIERAMVWEPSNAYCWMLWAEWFETQGHDDAHQWVLREATRVFPDNEAALTELARSLMKVGADDLTEAERLLWRATSIAPHSGQSHMVLAQLLRETGRLAQAKAVLEGFLQREPDDEPIRNALEQASHSRAGREVAAPSQVVGGDSQLVAFRAKDDHHVMNRVLKELKRRGDLGREFNKARTAMDIAAVTETPLIDQQANVGDTLAGFYSQWLAPETTPQPPPHAWAWKSCALWQSNYRDWEALAGRFPELAPQTHFLRVLDTGEGASVWRNQYATQVTDVHKSAMVFMADCLSRIEGTLPTERDEIALAVMASAATNTLDLTRVATV